MHDRRLACALLLIGAWLLFAPLWMPGFTSTRSIAADDSYFVGALLIVIGFVALASAKRFERWAEMALDMHSTGPRRS